MTEQQFNEYLTRKFEEIKNETEAQSQCEVTGDLECYARNGSFREYGTYGFDSEDELEDALITIEDIVNDCDVRIYHVMSNKVSIEGKFRNVKLALDKLASSIINASEILFEEPNI